MSHGENTVRLSAAGFSPWIAVNYRPFGSFAVGLGVKLSSNGNLTYAVQHTMDNIYQDRVIDWSASRTTTTGTVTKINHGLSVSDWVFFEAAAPFDIAYAVASITDQDTFTVTTANGGVSTVIWGSAQIHTARVFNHEDLDSETASADGNYAFPPRAVRLLVSSYTAGYVDLTVLQAGG